MSYLLIVCNFLTFKFIGHESAILFPQIVVTSEVATIGEGICTLWVAIEITGLVETSQPDLMVSGMLSS